MPDMHEHIVRAIDQLAVKMSKATRDAEATCTGVHLSVFGDGSYAVNYAWRANLPHVAGMTAERRAEKNMLATACMDRYSKEHYDTLAILIDFFKCQGVWPENGD